MKMFVFLFSKEIKLQAGPYLPFSNTGLWAYKSLLSYYTVLSMHTTEIEQLKLWFDR